MWTGDCGLRAWKTHESNLHYLKGINITAARGGRLGVWPYNPDFQDFLDLFAVFGPRRCLKSFLEAVRFISTHREPVASHGDPFQSPGHSTFLQVAALRIRDPEILRIFELFLASLEPGRYLKSFLEAVRFISTHREPVASHGDPFQSPGHSTFLQVAALRIRDPEILRIFELFLASLEPGRYLKSFLEAVRFISTHREPVASHGDPFRTPGHFTF